MQELIKRAVDLELEIKNKKKELDAIKLKIQQTGIQEIEDKNVKAVSYFTPNGEAIVMETQSLDILNVKELKKLFDGIWETKVTEEKPAIKYKLDKNFERALKAIFTGDYSFDYSLDEFLDIMSIKPDDKQKMLLLKKLKGDFIKDNELLNSVLGEQEPGFYDVDLWFIYKIKNAELIDSFIGSKDEIILEKIRKCLMVTNKTSITLNYDKGD